MLNVDKNGRLTINQEFVMNGSWKADCGYFAYIEEMSSLKVLIGFVEATQSTKGLDIIGKVKTDSRGRISPNPIMRNLPGKVNYEDWGVIYRDGKIFFMKSVALDYQSCSAFMHEILSATQNYAISCKKKK